MVGRLLLRGMLIGLVAGLVGFGFARVFGEPWVERAIAFEEQSAPAEQAAPGTTASHGAAASPGAVAADEGLVSRATQSGLGLLTGVMVYGVALGGLLALAFAFAHNRLGRLGARGTAGLVGLLGFLAAIVVPAIKYPANPPAVGQSETIGLRTEFFFSLLVLSVLAVILAVWLQRLLADRLGAWNAGIVAGLAYAGALAAAMMALPAVNEVPEAFPAALLWNFRLSAIGLQAVMWAVVSLGLGWQAERLLEAPAGSRVLRPRRAA